MSSHDGAQHANDTHAGADYRFSMKESAHEHRKRQPRRPHFIKEWAEAQGLKQADLSRELDADKSVISRWYAGASPGDEWQTRLAKLFGCEPEALFRHPDEYWLTEFFANRTRDEIEKMKQILEIAFPRKDGVK